MAIDPIQFEAKVKELYTANIMQLANQNPFAQKNPSYLIEFIHSISSTLAIDATKITCVTADVGTGGAPPWPGAGLGTMSVVNEPLLGHIYKKVRQAVIQTFGRTAHEEWPPSKGSGIYLRAILDAFTQVTTDQYNKNLQIITVNPLVYLGAFNVINGGFTPPQPNIMVSDIMGKAPSLKGSFWPVFVKAFVEGYCEYISQDLTGTGLIPLTIPCIPSLGQACGIPMAGAGVGTIT